MWLHIPVKIKCRSGPLQVQFVACFRASDFVKFDPNSIFLFLASKFDLPCVPALHACTPARRHGRSIAGKLGPLSL